MPFLPRMGCTSEWLKSVRQISALVPMFPTGQVSCRLLRYDAVYSCRRLSKLTESKRHIAHEWRAFPVCLHFSDPSLSQQFFSLTFVSRSLLACCWYSRVPSSLCVARDAHFVLELHSDMRPSGAVKCNHWWTVSWSCVPGTPITNRTGVATLT